MTEVLNAEWRQSSFSQWTFYLYIISLGLYKCFCSQRGLMFPRVKELDWIQLFLSLHRVQGLRQWKVVEHLNRRTKKQSIYWMHIVNGHILADVITIKRFTLWQRFSNTTKNCTIAKAQLLFCVNCGSLCSKHLNDMKRFRKSSHFPCFWTVILQVIFIWVSCTVSQQFPHCRGNRHDPTLTPCGILHTLHLMFKVKNSFKCFSLVGFI